MHLGWNYGKTNALKCYKNEHSFSTIWSLSSYKTIFKKHERKIHSESRDIDENDIVHWLGEMFGIFRRLAVEWRRLMLFMTS